MKPKYNGDGKCGGRGTCEYCGEMHNNVALHSAHYCSMNPIGGDNNYKLTELQIVDGGKPRLVEPGYFDVRDGL